MILIIKAIITESAETSRIMMSIQMTTFGRLCSRSCFKITLFAFSKSVVFLQLVRAVRVELIFEVALVVMGSHGSGFNWLS